VRAVILHGVTRATRTLPAVVIGGLCLCSMTACSDSRTVTYDDAEAIIAPTFAAKPASPGDSPQLAALTLRDTAGLVPDAANAAADVLPEAVAAVLAERPDLTEFFGISVYDDYIHVDAADPALPGRQISGLFNIEYGLSFSESFNDYPVFTLDGVDLSVPAALIRGITERYPSLRVTDVVLNPLQSYELGLCWNLNVVDARGSLATVFADLDGTVIAVDMS
jgi:hypothetical protein